METLTTDTITREQLLNHWQGHRRLTRRVIDAFPEKELFEFSVDGMRTFATLAEEVLGMATPTLDGIVSRKWNYKNGFEMEGIRTKEQLLAAWDTTTEQLNALWPQIPEGRFQETDVAFGQYEGPVHWILLYVIDNEIHHRAQGYVYLRALGIQPPFFWER